MPTKALRRSSFTTIQKKDCGIESTCSQQHRQRLLRPSGDKKKRPIFYKIKVNDRIQACATNLIQTNPPFKQKKLGPDLGNNKNTQCVHIKEEILQNLESTTGRFKIHYDFIIKYSTLCSALKNYSNIKRTIKF